MHNIINLIQDVATPHNNVLIREMVRCSGEGVRLWYAKEEDVSLYSWKENLTHQYLPATIYGTRLNLKFLWHCITHRNERYLIVGWANINTKLLHLLFFIMRRPFNHWTDLPDQNSSLITIKKKLVRYLAYSLLKSSKGKVFGVGKTTVEVFKKWGFTQSKLVNFPIFVDVENDLSRYHMQKQAVRTRYGIQSDEFLISAGSRIVHEKGYDLLLRALATIPAPVRSSMKIVLVGKGDQLELLKVLADDLHLSNQIVFVDWLSIEEFKLLIANSNLFLHPARFDSYGGTTLAMSLGVPVIGSKTAGAAYDRIDDGVNGFLYEAEDFQHLATLILQIFEDTDLRSRMAVAAHQTALMWHPQRGVETLNKELI